MSRLFVTIAVAVLAFRLSAAELDVRAAERFANLALACVHQEYPNKIAHTMSSDADVAPARTLTPAFYGCYDWHSSVHGHWLLARLARTFPDAPFAARARAALQRSITSENIAQEVIYLRGGGRASFERPYGLAWLLQLGAELRQSDPLLARVLQPLEAAANERLKTWLPKLSRPMRVGEHSQSAFAFGLILDSTNDPVLAQLVRDRSRTFFSGDRNCPLAYEPGGEDFLSPCIAEADLMRRVMPKTTFAAWLKKFLPKLDIEPAVSPIRAIRSLLTWMASISAAPGCSKESRRACPRATRVRGRFVRLQPDIEMRGWPPSPASTTKEGTGLRVSRCI